MSIPNKQLSYRTHNNELLNPKEYTFINEYVKTKNASQSVIAAGYKSSQPVI
jgi:hypothetical protein